MTATPPEARLTRAERKLLAELVDHPWHFGLTGSRRAMALRMKSRRLLSRIPENTVSHEGWTITKTGLRALEKRP